MSDTEYVPVKVDEVIVLTDKAIRIIVSGEDYWIPFSQIDEEAGDVLGEGESGTIWVAKWLAKKEGLI